MKLVSYIYLSQIIRKNNGGLSGSRAIRNCSGSSKKMEVQLFNDEDKSYVLDGDAVDIYDLICWLLNKMVPLKL